MSTARLRVFAGAYRDSLLLLNATRSMRSADGVEWATALMATQGNVADLGSAGFGVTELDSADANDLTLAVRADGAEAAEAALDLGQALLFDEAGPGERPGPAGAAPRTLEGAAAGLPGANVAIVSVPGEYAALAAHQALTSGLHVLLFSDNVPVADEVALKRRASGLGRLVMGPGAGTAVLGGVGLGFANAVRPGRVGVVAAAGTGAQEVMTLLDRWDIGVSQVIGVGGRDLSAAVGGVMAADAVRALDRDQDTDAILLVSKPPDPGVAAAVVAGARHTPVVAACVGMPADAPLPGAIAAATLEEGAVRVAERLGRPVPELADGLVAAARQAVSGLGPGRTAVRGFFSGGTLCYEAQVVLRGQLGDVYSNIPLDKAHRLPGQDNGHELPIPGGAHVCLDLGEEEYTKGRPHPMIDPAARREIMQDQALAPEVAVVLLDVVLGYGSHDDPAGEIAGICAEIIAGGAAVVAYVLGTRADPQGYDAQRARLAEAGVIVTPTAARAAWTAAAIAARQPELAGQGLAETRLMSQAPVALVTYSVKPRGGVVHTLALAEALHDRGYPVRVFALGDPAVGFYRPVRAPVTIIPAPPTLPTLEERVFASLDALAGGLAGQVGSYPVLHTQDCISARAAARIRDTSRGRGPLVIRTVHHVDDFTSPSLIECQRQAILEPDVVLVVSAHWRELLAADYGVDATVVHNGVAVGRFGRADGTRAAALRREAGADGRPLILAVGGIEPRKGSDTLMRAVAGLRRSGRDPVLAIVGGHSFQDYQAYRERVLDMLPGLGLTLGRDVVQLGTVPDADLPAWYAAADVLAFPSTKEGWGLAVLEAMAAGLPVVTSDLPVFREYLTPGRDAMMVPCGDAGALSAAITAVLDDPGLAGRLAAAGRAVCERFTWPQAAREHEAVYASAQRLVQPPAP